MTSTLGERLISLRESYGFKRKHMVELIGVNASYYGYWERDETIPSHKMLYKILVAFKCLNSEWLSEGIEPMWLGDRPNIPTPLIATVGNVNLKTKKPKKKKHPSNRHFTEEDIKLITDSFPEIPVIKDKFKSQIVTKARALGLHYPRDLEKERRKRRAYAKNWARRHGPLKTGMPSPKVCKAKIDQAAAAVSRILDEDKTESVK